MFEQSPAKPFPGNGPGGTNLTPAEWARKEESRKKAEFKRMSRSSLGSTSSRSSLGSSHAPPRARLSFGYGAAVASNKAFTPAPATFQGVPQYVSAPGGRSRSGAAASSGTESATAFSGGAALADRANIDPEMRAEIEKRKAEKLREYKILRIVEEELAGIPASELAPEYDEDVPPDSSSSPPKKKPALGSECGVVLPVLHCMRSLTIRCNCKNRFQVGFRGRRSRILLPPRSRPGRPPRPTSVVSAAL